MGQRFLKTGKRGAGERIDVLAFGLKTSRCSRFVEAADGQLIQIVELLLPGVFDGSSIAGWKGIDASDMKAWIHGKGIMVWR